MSARRGSIPTSWILAVALVMVSVISASIAAATVIVSARTVIYESKQNALLESFDRQSREVFATLSDDPLPEDIEYLAENLGGPSRIVNLTSGDGAGSLAEEEVPPALVESWQEPQSPLLFERAPYADGERFFITQHQSASASGPGYAVVTAYSLAEQRAQIDSLVQIALVTLACGVVLFAAAGTALGFGLARPLRDLSRRAQELKSGAPVVRDRAASRWREVDDVADELSRSALSLRDTMSDLQRREKISRRFVNDAAHELRTPLTSLLAASELLEDEDLSPEDRALATRVLRTATDKLARLVTELLELARLEAHVVSVSGAPIEVMEATRSAVSLTGHTSEVTVSGPDTLWVHTDARRLDTALSNLLVNAFVHGAPPVRVSVRTSEGRCRIDVSDTGPGVPPEQLETVFDRFSSGRLDDPDRPGTGLGLAIARESARAIGGDVIAQRSTQGAHFTIEFPSHLPAPK